MNAPIQPSIFAKSDVWQQADKQAAQIPHIKDKRTKRQQIWLLCETLKKALKGGRRAD